MVRKSLFIEFFKKGTGKNPFPYQVRLALEPELPDILHAPTGSGKTLAIIASWLWRRKHGTEGKVPRRLVYCLPMRVLVEQTYEVSKSFLEKAGFTEIGVYKILGGEVEEEWRYHPESEAIIIGTQDMLLSRALNRGFAMSRFAWPLDFAFLNNDCLWVFDEVQLMGNGLATSAQLAAFRDHLGVWGEVRSLWISATMSTEWLKTVDFQNHVEHLAKATLLEEDLADEYLKKRMLSKKVLRCYKGEIEPRMLAEFIKWKHQKETISLVILNTVEKAVMLYQALRAAYKDGEPKPDVILIHSRFRGADREKKINEMTKPVDTEAGRIIISTQVVEAGVDITSAFLLTELSPWPSMVQRLGRCNRYGEHEEAEVYWLDLEEKDYPPYEKEEMEHSRELLKQLENAILSPSYLQGIDYRSNPNYRFVIRKKDILELFDTTPDLTGYDIDISRFIRYTENLDLQVFWRQFDEDARQNVPLPTHHELCPVPFYDFLRWMDDAAKKGRDINAYIWDHIEGEWIKASRDMLRPGTEVLIPCEVGGYDSEIGWYPKVNDAVSDISGLDGTEEIPDSTSRDFYSGNGWVTLAEHSEEVRNELNEILEGISDVFKGLSSLLINFQDLMNVFFLAGLLHDAGKASPLFQEAFDDVPEKHAGLILAKGRMKNKRFPYGRKYFRHELVSAILLLQNRHTIRNWALTDLAFNLAVYIVAAHHGKVRCAIRALPHEDSPGDGRRFALGVWDGDVVDGFTLGGIRLPRTELNLKCMELGFDGEPSWVERCIELLGQFGPFRLSYLEALLRCADARVSAEE